MATVSLSENQILQVQAYIDKLDVRKNHTNYFVGKCGEIAVLNYGLNEKIYKNFYGTDLCKSVLKNRKDPDLGFDLLLESMSVEYKRLFVQVKTIMNEAGHNLLLNKNLYDPNLVYYTEIPTDIFILTKRLSQSTYDILGYITREDAIKHYVEDIPVRGCYCIDKKYLLPIENIVECFR